MGQTIKASSVLTPVPNKKRKEVSISEKPKFFLHVDADRDGKVDDDPNGVEEWEWGKGKKGAIVLVNNNGQFLGIASTSGSPVVTVKIDNEDSVVNGGVDVPDIAPLDIRRKGPPPPADWKATLEVVPEHQKFVRIFDSRGPSGNEIIGPNTTAKYQFPDLNFDKKEWGIEALRYAGKDFDGLITLTLTIEDPVARQTVGGHSAKVRVAPWIMFNHFNAPEKLFVVETIYNANFVSELTNATGIAGIPLEKVHGSIWSNDHWMQDIMEFGFSQLPGHIPLRNVLETPRGRQLRNFPKTLLSDQMGYAQPAPVPLSSSSLNSGGNLECTPPFKSPSGKEYPFGRMYLCRARTTAATDKLADGYFEFLSSQAVQPPILIDAGWLTVGHVDEIISFVPASTKLGFKLLLSSPRTGLGILDAIDSTERAATSAISSLVPSGSALVSIPEAKMLVGRNYVEGVLAETTVQNFLRNGISWIGSNSRRYVMTAAEIRSFNTDCQQKIDAVELAFKNEMGLTKDDIAYVPAVYVHAQGSGRADALTAGMVNMVVLGTHCIAPKPFGPIIGGKDMFEDGYRKTLQDCGLTVSFVDDWEDYHVMLGEVHCGSNTLRRPDSPKPWWEFQP